MIDPRVLSQQARMRDLQPLINRLVDDVLRLLRGASEAELRELMESADAGPPPRRRAARRSKPKATPKQAVLPARRRPGRRTRTVAVPTPAPEEPLHAEITDPERLLAAAAPAAIPAHPDVASVAAEEPSSPPNGERRAVDAGIVLRSGESLARASAHGGVVIRRSKRA